MLKKILGILLFYMVGMLNASESSEKLQRESLLIIQGEYDECVNCIHAMNDYTNKTVNNVVNLPGKSYYAGLEYLCSNRDNFKEHMVYRLKMIGLLHTLFAKAFGEFGQQEIKQQKLDVQTLLKDFDENVQEYQKNVSYCNKCKNCTFDDYNKDNIILDGYQYLEKIPQVGYFIKDKTINQLDGQLADFQKLYINLVHYKHHQLSQEGLYQYVDNLKLTPIDNNLLKNLPNNIQDVKISKWDLLHVFMGDIKGKHLAGVHNEDKDLFKNFYKRDDSKIMNVSIRKNSKYQKLSTFFPAGWDMKTCVKKAHEVFDNIDHITPGDQHGVGNIIVHGKANDGTKIAIVIDLAEQLIVSFYPET